jgi:hypothetical protein
VKNPRILRSLLALGLLAVAGWMGLQAARVSQRAQQAAQLCDAVAAGRWDELAKLPQPALLADDVSAASVECRCVAAFRQQRLEDCAVDVDALLRLGWDTSPIPRDLGLALVTHHLRQGDSERAARLAAVMSQAAPDDEELLGALLVAAPDVTLPRVQARAGSPVLQRALLGAAGRALEQHDAALALRLLGNDVPPSGDSAAAWFLLRARALALLRDVEALASHVASWKAHQPGSAQVEAQVAVLLSVNVLQLPGVGTLDLLERAEARSAEITDADLRQTLHHRALMDLVANDRAADALRLFRRVRQDLGDHAMTEAELLQAVAGQGGSVPALGEDWLSFTVKPALAGELRVSPPPDDRVDAPYESHAWDGLSPLRLKRARSAWPVRWVFVDAQQRVRGSGMAWPGDSVDVGLLENTRVPVFEPHPSTESGRMRVMVLVMDCMDWRFVRYLQARGELPVLSHLLNTGHHGVIWSEPAFTAAAMQQLTWPGGPAVPSVLAQVHRMGEEVAANDGWPANPLETLAWLLPQREDATHVLGSGELRAVDLLFAPGQAGQGRAARVIGPHAKSTPLPTRAPRRPLTPSELAAYPRLQGEFAPLAATVQATMDRAVELAADRTLDVVWLRVDPLDTATHAALGNQGPARQDNGTLPLMDFYRLLDARTGDVVNALGVHDVLLVISDHGIKTSMEHDERAVFILQGNGIRPGRLLENLPMGHVARLVADLAGVTTPWPGQGVASSLRSAAGRTLP